MFARALTAFVVVRNQPGVPRPPLPARTYRGGSLPRSKHFFFCAGRQYRQPMFLSSTADVQQAHVFMQEQASDGSRTSKTDAVLWTFVFDPRLGCNHINLIDRHDGTLGGDANQATPATSPVSMHVCIYVQRCCHVILAPAPGRRRRTSGSSRPTPSSPSRRPATRPRRRGPTHTASCCGWRPTTSSSGPTCPMRRGGRQLVGTGRGNGATQHLMLPCVDG